MGHLALFYVVMSKGIKLYIGYHLHKRLTKTEHLDVLKYYEGLIHYSDI